MKYQKVLKLKNYDGSNKIRDTRYEKLIRLIGHIESIPS